MVAVPETTANLHFAHEIHSANQQQGYISKLAPLGPLP